MKPANVTCLAFAAAPAAVLDDMDRRLIRETQGGLPLVERPYHELAQRIGIAPAEVMRRLRDMQARGAIRRIGAVPNHYRLGYVANGMSVWDVADAHVDELGRRVAQLPGVSHCYRRPRHPPAWPYNLFVMLHGRTRAEVAAQVAEVERLLGTRCRAHDVLYSTRILKKTGLRLT
jgi:DNA-binding Lrp family transcriptional regulator